MPILSSSNKNKPRKTLLNNKAMFYILPGVLLLILALTAFFRRDSARFDRLCDDILCETFASDPLSLHFFLEQPQKYGLSQKELDAMVFEFAFQNSDDSLAKCIESLEVLNPENLSLEQQKLYRLLLSYLTTEQEISVLTPLFEPLSPTSGIQTQLPVLLAEYRMENKEDIASYFSILSQLPSYFENISAYEAEKAANGTFLSQKALSDVVLQCQDVADTDAITDGSHFLVKSFEEKTKQLLAEDKITDTEAKDYRLQNQKLLIDSYASAYHNLASSLIGLKSSCGDISGLCCYQDGREYYVLQLKKQTGSSKSIPEIRELLQEDFTTGYTKLRTLSSTINPSDLSADFLLTKPEEMLEALIEETNQHFPQYSQKEALLVDYTVKNVTKGLENYLSPAFYLIPPYDNVSQNTIYINYGHKPDNLTLFTTLAHEGYPGHLYQSVFFYTNMHQNEEALARALLHYGGYVEGYATYAENLSYEYAKEYGNADYIELIRLTRNLQLCLYSLMDIAIHYDNLSLEGAENILLSIGVDNKDTAEQIYYYITYEPATYPKYYLGYLEVLECNKLAQKSWGNRYSEMEFHRFLLEYGPADYETLKTAITQY